MLNYCFSPASNVSDEKKKKQTKTNARPVTAQAALARGQCLAHLIGPDETVLANHICPFMLPSKSSRGRL